MSNASHRKTNAKGDLKLHERLVRDLGRDFPEKYTVLSPTVKARIDQLPHLPDSDRDILLAWLGRMDDAMALQLLDELEVPI